MHNNVFLVDAKPQAIGELRGFPRPSRWINGMARGGRVEHIL